VQKLIAHRLYTEDVNRQTITDILAKHLPAFTLLSGVGIWAGAAENSLIIEVIGGTFAAVAAVVVAIKEANKQDTVLYTAHEVKVRFFQ